MELQIEVRVPASAFYRGDGPRIATEEIQGAVEAGLMMIRGAVSPLTPKNLGLLAKGFQTSVDAGEDVRGRIFNPLEYAKAVEEGSRPHFPPAAALERWVQLKLGVPAEDAPGVAFVIARAISKRGTKAHHMLRDAVAASTPRIRERFARANARIKQRLSS